MKTAVLLYGHVRTFEQCRESFNENVLSVNDCDVFMHTWDEMDHNTQSWYGQLKGTTALDDALISDIKKFYAPKDIMIEHQEKIRGGEYYILRGA